MHAVPRTVLIVDDEPGITVALMLRLQAIGYEVFHAINGFAGLEAAEMYRPDVIVLDVRMPDIDGIEVCLRLKEDNDLRNIPIVILSANVQETTKQRAFKAGASSFIAKPYEPANIIQTLESLLSQTVVE